MLKPQDLRIGNLILNGIGEPFEVSASTIGNWDLAQATLGVFKPILLNEEWLLRFGFSKTPENEQWLRTDNWLWMGKYFVGVRPRHDIPKDVSHCHFSVMMVNTPHFLRNIHYVHQLQNLYFSLAGHELAIKTPEHA